MPPRCEPGQRSRPSVCTPDCDELGAAMGDRFRQISMEALTDWVFDELEQKDQLLGAAGTFVADPEV